MKRLSGSLTGLLLLVMSLDAAASAGLVDAVKKTDKAAVRALIAQKVDVNTPEADGTTALHWAARMEDAETAELLIRAGANVKAANRYGVAPLSVASINGNAAIIEMLLKAGADANTVIADGETALMTAARSGNVAAVKLLLAHGANVNAVEVHGQTALMWAAAEGNTEVVSALVAAGADMKVHSAAGFTAFMFAVRAGKIPTVRTMLDAGANVNEVLVFGNPLRQRRFQNNKRLVEGPSALVLATGNAHFDLAALLLDRGADPNLSAGGRTALHEITWVRRPGFGENMPAPPGSGHMDSLELVRKLVAHGADLNARMTKNPDLGMNISETNLTRTGATAFMMAARAADVELMRLLVELGADPSIPNKDNTTPLMAAAGVGNRLPGEDPGTESEVLEALKFLLDLGADVNAVDNNGESALHGAAYRFLPSAVHFLAEHGARVEMWGLQKNRKGQTPLNIAQGVMRGTGGCLLLSPATEAAIREVLGPAGATLGLGDHPLGGFTAPAQPRPQAGAVEQEEEDQDEEQPKARPPQPQPGRPPR